MIVVVTEIPAGNVAFNVTAVSALTVTVVTVTVAVFAPTATVTEAGMLATEGLLDARATAAPALGPVSVTVAVVFEPPIIWLLAGTKETTRGANTVSLAVLNEPPGRVALIVTNVSLLTAKLLIVNDAELEPDAMDTLEGGTATDGLSLARDTVTV